MQGCWQSGRVVEAERRQVENRGSLEWDELLDDEVPVEGSQSSWAPKLAYGGEPAADAWERARHRKWKGEVAGNPPGIEWSGYDDGGEGYRVGVRRKWQAGPKAGVRREGPAASYPMRR